MTVMASGIILSSQNHLDIISLKNTFLSEGESKIPYLWHFFEVFLAKFKKIRFYMNINS